MEPNEPFKLVDDNLVLKFAGKRYYLTVADVEMVAFEPHLGQLVQPRPDERPRRVGMGLFYGTQIFLPFPMSAMNQPALLQARWAIASQLAAEQRRSRFGGGSIPEALHGEVIDRSDRHQTPREIAEWLSEEKGVKTSHASVARLVHRHQRTAAQARLTADAPKVLADLDAQREAFNSAMDTLAQLEDHLVERIIDGGTEQDPVAEQAIRLAHKRAALLDRQIRATTALLTSRAGLDRGGWSLDAQPLTAPQPRAPANDVEPGPARASMSALARFAGPVLALLIVFGAAMPTALAAIPESGLERTCTGSASPFSAAGAPLAVQVSNVRRGDGALLQQGHAFEIEVRVEQDSGIAALLQKRSCGAPLVGNLRPQGTPSARALIPT